jgi:hypothetical protein
MKCLPGLRELGSSSTCFVEGQAYFGLKNLVLESGREEPAAQASLRSFLAEYLAWRLMELSGPIRLAAIEGEIDRAFAVAGPSLDSDPHLAGDDASATRMRMRDWWSARHAQVSAQAAKH